MEMSSVRLNDVLLALASKEKPSQAYVEKGIGFVQQAFEILQRDSKYNLDRVVIVGSIAKDTALGEGYQPDLDCTILVNDYDPPFDTVVLPEFKLILENAGRNGELRNFELVQMTKYAVMFRIDGVHIDLLPATSFVNTRSTTENTTSLVKRQVRATNKKILELNNKEPLAQKNAHGYGASFCELAVNFVKKQSAFVHHVVRLAKIWDKKIETEERVVGRSYIIEMVAIKSGRLENQSRRGKRGRKQISVAFRAFLRDMAMFSTIQVYFKDNYTIMDIPENVFSQIPLVLDPVNPFNNLANGVHNSAVELYKKHAEITLKRLDSFCDSNNNVEDLF